MVFHVAKEGNAMKKLICLLAVAFAATAGSAYAATAQQNKMKECNAQAGEKALKGDERKAFMKECLSAKKEEPAPAADKKTAQQEKMKTCSKEAGDKALKGDDRKKFMSDCLKG